MSRCFLVFVGCAFLASASLSPSDQAASAAQIKPTVTQPKAARAKTYRVQVRSPYWKAVAVAPNRTVATAMKRALNRQGWRVQMRANRAGQVAVRARMLSWHTRARVVNPAAAARIGSILQAQGFQVRIL